MNGFDSRPLDALGNEPMAYWLSFATNASINPDPASFRAPVGLKAFTVTYGATGVYTVTLPVGLSIPIQPGAIIASAQFATIGDYFEVAVLGETTLNAATRQIVIQAKRAAAGYAPGPAAGNRINVAVFFNNSTGA